jgi:hypothetical protein
LLERGSIGEAVERWQNFLIGQDILEDLADGGTGSAVWDKQLKTFDRRELQSFLREIAETSELWAFNRFFIARNQCRKAMFVANGLLL